MERHSKEEKNLVTRDPGMSGEKTSGAIKEMRIILDYDWSFTQC